MSTYARLPLADAINILVHELDDLLGRILRRDPHLELQMDAPPDYWLVIDKANQDVVMMRADLMTCVRFMDAFAKRHPEAHVNRWSITEAVRDANIAAREQFSVKAPTKLEVVQ